jgi:hypothetical protein
MSRTPAQPSALLKNLGTTHDAREENAEAVVTGVF